MSDDRPPEPVMVDLFAGVPVRDYVAAAAWYERLLCGPAAFLRNETEAGRAPVPLHRSLARARRSFPARGLRRRFVVGILRLCAELTRRRRCRRSRAGNGSSRP